MDTKKYQHPLNVRSRTSGQMEMEHDSFVGQSPLSEDLESKLRDNQLRLERLKAERDEAERVTQELEELNSKKSKFLSSQVEISEKLTNAVTLIERELLAMRKEEHELEQCHEAFVTNLKKIAKFDPESWTRDNMHANLDKALIYMDQTLDGYDEAAKYFSSKNSAGVFGATAKKTGKQGQLHNGEFLEQLKSGFAFTLPLITVAVLALLVYAMK